jgi:phosphate transport system substrate-binding protein
MRARRTGTVRRTSRFTAPLLALALTAVAALPMAALTLSETGSTLIYPLFQEWAGAYAKVDPGMQLTLGSTGSGAGIAAAIAKQVQIGTSDAYMTDNQAMANPHVLNIPLAISAQTVDANLPELHGAPLKLSGLVLAGIYTGKIRTWDAPEIAAINRGVSLPHHAIVPVHRSDGSGDTFIFTQFLTFTTCASGESDDPACHGTWADKIAYGTSVPWPSVAGAVTANGNAGMLQTLAGTPYSVGYLGASFEDQASKASLITAMLQNQDGHFLLPTPATVTAAAAALTPRTPADERLTLVFAPGPNSYPLINYEYAMVWDKQPNPQTASALSNFLLWCISPQGGSAASFLDPVHFIALPTPIRARSEMQIAKIQ